MLHYYNLSSAIQVFKALSAEVRIQIMELLYQDGGRSMNDLAKILGLSNSAISLHIGKLEEAGLVKIHTVPAKRGSMKICEPTDVTLFVEMNHAQQGSKSYNHHIEVGQYTQFHAEPTCGLATVEHVIGEYDDPRYFAFPERIQASLLWLSNGFVEYILPNSLKAGERLTELSVSMELASEAPGTCENYPSDLYFSINGILLGCWISPGDFGAHRGRFNPTWWPDDKNQYGLLKKITVNSRGTFLDEGMRLSDITVDDLKIDYNSTVTLRIAAPEDTKNAGGLTLFGKDFGDYNQGIKFCMVYE